MTIDETIKKYRKLSNSDRTCYSEEAAQIAEWMEELKERRQTNFDYVSLMDKRYYDGYNKAIDDFVKKAKELKHEDGELSDIDLDYIAGFLRMESEEHGKNI